MYISFKFNVKINKYKYFPLVKSENKVIYICHITINFF